MPCNWMADESLLDNIGAVPLLQLQYKAPVIVQESGASKKKNSEIKHKSNSVHRGLESSAALQEVLEIFLSFFTGGAHNSARSSSSLSMVGIHKHSSLLYDFLKRRLQKKRAMWRRERCCSVYRNTKDWRFYLSAVLFQSIWCIPGFPQHSYRCVPCRYERPNTPPTHTPNSPRPLLLLCLQNLLLIICCGWWDDVYVIILFCIQKSNSNGGLEKFIKKTYSNSHICFENSSKGLVGLLPAGCLYGDVFLAVCIVLGNIVYVIF